MPDPMAVGRLPRDQRNIGGIRPHRRPSIQQAPVVASAQKLRIPYPAVRWEATLREPLGSFPHGPRTFVVDVVGNIDLAGVPIDLRIAPKDGTVTGWYPAAWLSTDGNRGTCTAHVVNPPKGRCDVLVRPNAAGQRPTLECQYGRIVVQ